MAMVNTMLNLTNVAAATAAAANVKDSRWLTLEVCREYQRNKCTRTETECKFAHPPPHVEVQNGRVTACFDSIKGKCQRKDPPCKYLHPPQHLREQLLQNGKNNLIIRNLHMQQAAQQAAALQIVPGMMPMTGGSKPAMAAYPIMPGQYPLVAPQYMSAGSVPTSAVAFSHPYISQGGLQAVPVPSAGTDIMTNQIPGVMTAIPSQQKIAATRADRLEVCREFQRGTCTRQPSECRYAHPPDNVTVDCTENHVTVCMDYVKGKCTRDSCKYFHPPPHLQSQIKATQQRANTAAAQALPQVVEVIQGKKRPRDHDDLVLQSATIPGLIPYKRVAVADSKSGLPVYQPGTNMNISYQQAIAAMQLQQQQYIPTVTYNKSGLPVAHPAAAAASTQSSPAIQQAMQTVQIPQQQLVPVTMPLVVSPAAEAATALVAAPSTTNMAVPINAYTVNYFDANQQLLDTLPVCRDFKLGQCNRPQCKYVHILEDYVEVKDGRTSVCRDAVRGKCTRAMCKYYHIPIELPNSK